MKKNIINIFLTLSLALISSFVFANQRNDQKFYEAIKHKNIQTVKNYISNNKVNINSITYFENNRRKRESPVYVAALNRSWVILKYLLDYGANVKDGRALYALSTLKNAPYYQQTYNIKSMLDRGANVNYINPKTHDTALHQFAKYNKLDNVKWMLRHGANVHIKDNKGRKASDIARIRGYKELETFLKRNENGTFQQDKKADDLYKNAIRQDNVQKVAAMINQGKASINSFKSTKSGTPLSYAGFKLAYKVSTYLINQGADVNRIGSSNGMALPVLLFYAGKYHQLGKKKCINLVKLYVRKGVKLNHLSKYFQYPLIIAASKNAWEIVQLFLAHGAKRNVSGHYWYTPASIAALEGHLEMAYFLSGKMSRTDYRKTLFYAVESENIGLVKQILSRNGREIRAQEPWSNKTALMMACKLKDSTIAKLLISYGAPVKLASKTRTPLLEATIYNRVELALLLIQKGADPNAVQKSGCAGGNTAFSWAVTNNSYKLVKAMWDTGKVKPYIKKSLRTYSDHGYSVYYSASNMKMVRFLAEECRIKPPKEYLITIKNSNNKYYQERYQYFKSRGYYR